MNENELEKQMQKEYEDNQLQQVEKLFATFTGTPEELEERLEEFDSLSTADIDWYVESYKTDLEYEQLEKNARINDLKNVLNTFVDWDGSEVSYDECYKALSRACDPVKKIIMTEVIAKDSWVFRSKFDVIATTDGRLYDAANQLFQLLVELSAEYGIDISSEIERVNQIEKLMSFPEFRYDFNKMVQSLDQPVNIEEQSKTK